MSIYKSHDCDPGGELVVLLTWGLDRGVLSSAEDHLNRGVEGGERGELGILAGGRGTQGVLGSHHGAARVTWGAQVGWDVLQMEGEQGRGRGE